MEIIDILTPIYTNCPTFVVNRADPHGWVQVWPPVNVLYRNSNTDYKFQNGDNLILLSAGFILPECFVMADTPKAGTSIAANEMQLFVYKGTSLIPPHVGLLPGVGNRGVVVLPMENYEIALNIFCDMSTLLTALAGATFAIQGTCYLNNISMQNIPVGLDGTTQHIIPFIKVLHSLPIIP